MMKSLLKLKWQMSILLDQPCFKRQPLCKCLVRFFHSFLPSKYRVDKGCVFVSKGNVSGQIDVIIYDSLYAPLIFDTEAGEKFITAESVYAVFDSKPKVDKNTLEYSDSKISSVKKLVRSSREVINAGNKFK